MGTFFQGFNFDTVLAIISCITAIIGLFLGGKSYQKCKKMEKILNDNKTFGDNGIDNSQKAGRDVINNTYDPNTLVNLSTANFSVALEKAYKTLEKSVEKNMQTILTETKRIIKEKN